MHTRIAIPGAADLLKRSLPDRRQSIDLEAAAERLGISSAVWRWPAC